MKLQDLRARLRASPLGPIIIQMMWLTAALVSILVLIVGLRLARAPVWIHWAMLVPAAFIGIAAYRAHVHAKWLESRLRSDEEAWDIGRIVATVRGEPVRSWSESRIANWLHARGYAYTYEPYLCGFRPDFYLSDLNLIIEFWGMDPLGSPRRKEKVAAYTRAGYHVISLDDWRSAEADLERKLYRFDKTVYERARR